ncbi:MAG: MarR family transcriptional regulator [Candidatus Promineifilaceae bacterium]
MSETQILARQILEIIPPVMRMLSADIRGSGHLPSPAQFGVMVTLAYHSCNLSSLADDQGVSLPTMSSTINTLEERGWVRRTRSTVDRRVVIVELTEAGLDQLLIIRCYAEERLMALLGSITDVERDSLTAGLSVMKSIFDVTEGQISQKEGID